VDFGDYQSKSMKTDTRVVIKDSRIAYYALGIADEAGEVAGKIKKLIREKDSVLTEDYKKEIVKELGDVLWYMTQMCTYMDVKLEDVAKSSIEKIMSRQERGRLFGKGDNR